jgi:hypothetical protein
MKEGVKTYPQIKGESGWGIFCHSEEAPIVTREVGEVICRQTCSQFLFEISKTSTPPEEYDGVYYSGSISCPGKKNFLSQCKVNLSPESLCAGGYTTVECTPVLADLVPDIGQLRDSLQSYFVIVDVAMRPLWCALQEQCLGSSAWKYGNSRKLLRFDSLTWNYGLADFKPVAHRSDWQWHSCHNHYHSIEDFVHYNLLYAGTERTAAEGHKASFCLEDTLCLAGYPYRYRGCSARTQAISVNCGDLYNKGLDCQWVDITDAGVRDDLQYELRLSVNPHRLGLESDYRNNNASCLIQFREVYQYGWWEEVVEVERCWLSDH